MGSFRKGFSGTLSGHSQLVTNVVFGVQGDKLFSASWDTTLKSWDVEKMQELHTWKGHQNAVLSLAINGNGSRIASGGRDGTILIWDIAERRIVNAFSGNGEVTCLDYGPLGANIVSGGSDGVVRIWDAVTGNEKSTFLGHSATVFAARFSPDGRRVASVGADRHIRTWRSLVADSPYVIPTGTMPLRTLDVATAGDEIAVGGFGEKALIINLASKQVRLTLVGHEAPISGLVFSPNSRELFTASNDGTMRKWNTLDGTNVFVSPKNASLSCIAISPWGNQIATGCSDRSIQVWDAQDGTRLHRVNTFDGEPISLSFDSDGGRLAVGFRTRTDQAICCEIFDTSTWEAMASYRGHTSDVLSLSFSSDGSFLATGGNDRRIMIWESSNATPVRTLENLPSSVRSIRFLDGDTRVLIGGTDGGVRLLSTETGAELLALISDKSQPVADLDFSSKTQSVFVCREECVEVWGKAVQQVWDNARKSIQKSEFTFP